MSGISRSARTSAYPIRWVKETLPPRARARWLLMTMRLSHNSLTGTDRTLVAVGTLRLRSMFWAVRAGAPRSGVTVGSSVACAGALGVFSLGTGAGTGLTAGPSARATPGAVGATAWATPVVLVPPAAALGESSAVGVVPAAFAVAG